MANPESLNTGPKSPEQTSIAEEPGEKGDYDPGPASPDQDLSPEQKRREDIEQTRERMRGNEEAFGGGKGPERKESPSAEAPSQASENKEKKGHGGSHHKKNWTLERLKDVKGVFGYIFELIWEGIKRWPEMMGKGGGATKKKDDGHGGGGGHAH